MAEAARRGTEAAQLNGLAPAPGAGWATSVRQAALGRLHETGLPRRRDEYWRFTRPETLTSAAVIPVAATAAEPELFADAKPLAIVFVDGMFDEAASDPLEGTNLTVERLAAATAADIHWARDLFGALEAAGQAAVPRPLASLVTGTAPDGVVIHATGPVARPVSILYRRSRDDAEAVLHHVVRVDPGASLTLLEQGVGAARLMTNLEVEIGDGGTFHHVRAQGRDRARRAATHVFAQLGAASTLKSFTIALNGALTRNEAVIALRGDGGVAHVAGVAVGDGAFHHDDTVFVDHGAAHCESRQVFKKVLKSGAVGVFQGKILVQEGAQKTDGYQISQSLLLDDDAQFLAKPELEIYADDVVCSHGSTSGAIDPEQLYYLRARGIGKAEATDLLTIAFLAEALEEIEDDALAGELVGRLEAWLRRRS